MSASATIPQQEPPASTTGTRLICFSSKILQHSSIDISGVTVTHGFVMQSAAIVPSGLIPFATIRQTISRSVITPTGSLLALSSTTGISPQSLSAIILATPGIGVSAVQQTGSAVIN